jgi:dihydroorotate dehydrogenase (fumarate)
VLRSLFEEQIRHEQRAAARHLDAHADSSAEALSYFPSHDAFVLGPDEYLEHVRKVKAAVRVPVIASLNGSSTGGWLDYAKRIQEAGADALELNEYALATDPGENAEAVESRAVQVLKAVRATVTIPVAVKLSPFYSALPHLAQRLVAAGADGLVLFNRFYQPDIDTEALEVERALHLSDSSDLLLRLRWLAVLSPNVKASLAASGGVHTSQDAIKAVMAGAQAVQMVSALLTKGPKHLAAVRREMAEWLEKHEYSSLQQMHGSMNHSRCPDAAAYERANYMHILMSWRS